MPSVALTTNNGSNIVIISDFNLDNKDKLGSMFNSLLRNKPLTLDKYYTISGGKYVILTIVRPFEDLTRVIKTCSDNNEIWDTIYEMKIVGTKDEAVEYVNEHHENITVDKIVIV